MSGKFWVIIGVILICWFLYTNYLINENNRISKNISDMKIMLNNSNNTIKDMVNEAKIKEEAFREREEKLITDRKEIENEYAKLLELQKTSDSYASWCDVPLPDCVCDFVQ